MKSLKRKIKMAWLRRKWRRTKPVWRGLSFIPELEVETETKGVCYDCGCTEVRKTLQAVACFPARCKDHGALLAGILIPKKELIGRWAFFWMGFVAGCIAMFFYAWLSIWVTYVDLERGHREREAQLGQIKRILFSEAAFQQEILDIKDWNRKAQLPGPVLVVPEEEQ